MSRRFVSQAVHGLLLLDKEPGFSSNAAVQRAKRLLSATKVGHTGSLDPIATGLLPLCFGEATKLSGFLLDTDKRYQVRVRLGKTTNTADIEGEVLEVRSVPDLTPSFLESELNRFRGDLLQIPPMYSALRHKGKKLYELARQGKEVERPPRAISIHSLQLLNLGADFLDLDVHCSKGTYIRSLAVDLGEAIGCGGHVEILRRTAVGRLTIEQAITLSELEGMDEIERQSRLLPADVLVDSLPTVCLPQEQRDKFVLGQAVDVPVLPGLMRVYDTSGRLLGLGVDDGNGQLQPRRVLTPPIETGGPAHDAHSLAANS